MEASSAISVNADALEDSEIAAIPRNEFDDLMNSNHQVMHKFIKLIASNVTEKEEQLLHMSYDSLRKKVAEALLTVQKMSGNKTGLFNIQLSRENLAAIAGTATESLIRTLTDFKSEKLIDIQEGKIAILNISRLETMVN